MACGGLHAETPLVGTKTGDVKATIDGAAKKVEAIYAYPFQNHACMEPMSATALYSRDKCGFGPALRTAKRPSAAIEASGLPATRST